MEEAAKSKVTGWEIAEKLDKEKTVWERLNPGPGQIKAALVGVVVFFILFLIGTWLAGNPFEFTVRLQSKYIVSHGIGGEWQIIWLAVILAAIFEFLDASAGMGFGTALTPMLLMVGFDPQQIVPVVMIQQGAAGLVGAFLHREFQNVEWKWSPMSETVKLALIIVITGIFFNVIAIVGVYKIFKVPTIWIKVYVALLLLMMGVMSLYTARKQHPYKPKKMFFWASLAGFNKGVGGGGYGPVCTIGGILSGVPVKSMMAVTAISEGSVSTVAVLTWFLMMSSGVQVDYILLPSFMLATMFSAVAAPYVTRVLPERVWKFVVPTYSLVLTAYTFYKVIPDVIKYLGK